MSSNATEVADVAALQAQRDEIDAKIKSAMESVKSAAKAAWDAVDQRYDYTVKRTSDHKFYFSRAASPEFIRAAEEWENRWVPLGVPRAIGEVRKSGGMSFWLVYDADGSPLLISEGGGLLIVRDNPEDESMGWGRYPVRITREECDAVLRGEFPESLRRK